MGIPSREEEEEGPFVDVRVAAEIVLRRSVRPRRIRFLDRVQGPDSFLALECFASEAFAFSP